MNNPKIVGDQILIMRLRSSRWPFSVMKAPATGTGRTGCRRKRGDTSQNTEKQCGRFFLKGTARLEMRKIKQNKGFDYYEVSMMLGMRLYSIILNFGPIRRFIIIIKWYNPGSFGEKFFRIVPGFLLHPKEGSRDLSDLHRPFPERR